MQIRFHRSAGVLAFSTIMVLFVAQPPVALADYRVVGGITQNVGGSFTPIDNYDLSGIIDAGGQVNYDQAPGEPEPSYHAQADSEAGYGLLRAHAFSQLIKPLTSASGFTLNQTASGTAYATFTDIVISGPAAASVPASLNLHLSGAHTVISQETPGNSVHASSSVQVGILFNDSNIGGGDHAIQSIDGDLMPTN